MSKEELKGFKISEQVKAPVDKPRAKKAEASPAPSVGFPRIEALVESGELSGLEGRLQQLKAMQNAGGNKEKLAAKKAAAAYERAHALLVYLLDTKARLSQQG